MNLCTRDSGCSTTRRPCTIFLRPSTTRLTLSSMIHQSPSPRWFPAPYDVLHQMTITSGVCLQMVAADRRRADRRVEVIQ